MYNGGSMKYEELETIHKIFEKYKLYAGRLISAYKEAPKGCVCVWNANIVSPSKGKIWYGDINITREGDILKKIAEELGEPLYVLRESGCRFDTEDDTVKLLISRAVWSTDKE